MRMFALAVARRPPLGLATVPSLLRQGHTTLSLATSIHRASVKPMIAV
jgi:hypothetical protein